MKKMLLFLAVLVFGCNPPTSPTVSTQPMLKLSKEIVVYDFGAPWCPPCRAFKPIFESWKTKYGNDHVEFEAIDTDEDQEMAAKFKVSALPTVVITVNGAEVKRWVGAPKESEIQEFLK